MSPAPSHRRPEPKGKVKTGICTNKNYLNPKTDEMGECPKCQSGEKIKVEVKRISDFRCPVCGEKLTPVKESIPVWIWGAAAAAVVAIVLLVVFLNRGGDDSAKNNTPIDGIAQVDPKAGNDSDSVGVVVHEVEKDSVKEPKVENPTAGDPGPTNTQPKPKSVLGGAATISTSGGYTTIKFNRSYNLDMGDYDHSTISISADDEIYMANVQNGILYGGQLKRRNGEEISIHGIKVRL